MKTILILAILLFGAKIAFAQSSSISHPVTFKLDGPMRNLENEGPLIVLYSDGYQGYFAQKEIEQIKPETIEKMNVLKENQSTAQFGKSGKNGVIQIYLKENTFSNLSEEIQKLMVKIED